MASILFSFLLFLSYILMFRFPPTFSRLIVMIMMIIIVIIVIIIVILILDVTKGGIDAREQKRNGVHISLLFYGFYLLFFFLFLFLMFFSFSFFYLFFYFFLLFFFSTLCFENWRHFKPSVPATVVAEPIRNR